MSIVLFLWGIGKLREKWEGALKDLIEQEEEVASLTEQLETRKIIERAKGHLIERGLTEQEAFRKIRKVSMDNDKSMREVGEAILLAKDM